MGSFCYQKQVSQQSNPTDQRNLRNSSQNKHTKNLDPTEKKKSNEHRDRIKDSAYPNLVASSSYGGDEQRGWARRRREVHGGALPAVKRRERRRERRARRRTREIGFRREENEEKDGFAGV